MYKILFTKKAEKDLDKLTRTDVIKIIKTLQNFTYPFPPHFDIKKLVNTPDFYRIRTGKIRIIFEIEHKQKTIWIRKAGYRGGIYRF